MKYKVGDKVKVLKNWSEGKCEIGILTTSFDNDGDYGMVTFENGNQVYVSEHHIELVQEACYKSIPKFKKYDLIETEFRTAKTKSIGIIVGIINGVDFVDYQVIMLKCEIDNRGYETRLSENNIHKWNGEE